MTDIVERLRGGWNHDRNPEADMAEAADCIAKLEQQLIEWKELAMPTDDTTLNNLLAEGQSRLSRLERSVSRMTAEGEKMFAWLKRLFDRSNDPVYSCEMYRDKEAGSCTHVDGPLCDFPKCSMLADYRQQKEGMTIKDDPRFREDLRKMMAEQRGKSGPVPHA